MQQNISNTKIQETARQAVIAALYVAMTWIIKDFSYGPLQMRISEILTLLVFYNKKHMSGLLIGCFIANILSPFGILDMAVGTFASFAAFSVMCRCKNIFVASLMPGFFSFFIIIMLLVMGEIPASVMFVEYLKIFASEFVIVCAIGIPFFKSLEKYPFFEQYIR